MHRDDIKVLTRGRWPSILSQLGMDSSYLNGRDGPCPMCSGKDRWKFLDTDGNGTYYCRGCGGKNGDGRRRLGDSADHGVEARQLARRVRAGRGGDRQGGDVRAPAERVGEDQARAAMKWHWANAKPVDGNDPASFYLASRAITILPPSSAVRFAESVPDYDPATKKKTYRPALLSRLVGEDARHPAHHLFDA